VIVHHQRLVAFVTGPVDRAALALPPWMMPARFVVGPLPRTPTGKVDRAALVVPPTAAMDPLARAWCDALGVDSVRPDDRFSEVGGDSLARLMLKVAIDALLAEVDGASSTSATVSEGVVDALDGDPTFGELAARIHARRIRPPLTVGECEACGLAMLRAQPRRSVAKRSDGAVLITGVNGQLARALVQAWRRREPTCHIIGLVRDPRVDLDIDEIVCGDIRDDAWHAGVRDRIAAVVHCAATIQLGGDWDAHVETNVRGTAQIARLVGDDIAWHHISTLSVFVNTSAARGRHVASDQPAPDAIAYGGYAQTKIAAEAIARARGASIYRLGLLTGRADDQRTMTLRALAKLGAAPAGFRDACYDETPVSYAAEQIAALAHEAPATFHVAAGSTRFGDIIDRMQLVELPHPVWLERARAAIGDPDVAMAIGAFSRRPDLDLFLATGATFR
jgi:dTDP-4-dehydrorhamnose reductase